jgi:hypothetical protein
VAKLSDEINRLYKDHLKEANDLKVDPPHDNKGMLLPLLKPKESVPDPGNPDDNNLYQSLPVKNSSNNLPPSNIASTILTTINNNKEEEEKRKKSPISLKDNSNVLILIDQIFALIIRLYGEVKAEEDENVKKKKEGLIGILLGLVKIVSYSPDNHKTIFEIVS